MKASTFVCAIYLYKDTKFSELQRYKVDTMQIFSEKVR